MKMDSLPILPFEKILGYLSLEDSIRSRAVSRYWRDCIDSFRVKSLCCSHRPIGFILGKSRLVTGAFARNFIGSPRIESFLNMFGRSILSSLKHLRLFDLEFNEESTTAFARTLNSFGQLEELDIFRFNLKASFRLRIDLDLNLPMLNSILFEEVHRIKLTLDAPKLQIVKLLHSPSRLNIVHGESVERLITNSESLELGNLKNLKNLKYLYIKISWIDSTLLASLEQLKEIHLFFCDNVSGVFDQKQRYGRADLKIYLFGCLLNGRDDPAIDSLFNGCHWLMAIRFLAANLPILADEIPFHNFPFEYTHIDSVASRLAMPVLRKFTNWESLHVPRPVQDIERFLQILENFDNIVELWFQSDQPQVLFDRLPKYSAVQKLRIAKTVPDLGFLLKLKDLNELDLLFSIDTDFIRKVLEELPFLYLFWFRYKSTKVTVRIEHPKRIEVVQSVARHAHVSDLNALIQLIEKTPSPPPLYDPGYNQYN